MSNVIPLTAAPPALADRKRDLAQRIIAFESRTVADALSIGRDLIDLKNSMPHGEFGRWLADEVSEKSARTWQRWMAAAEVFEGKYDTLSVLSRTEIHKLAAKSTPAEIRDEVVASLEAGQTIDMESIDGRIWQAKEEKAKAVKAARRAKAREAMTPAQIRAATRREAKEAEEQAEMEERARRREDARDRTVLILAERLGDDLQEVIDLLKEAEFGSHALAFALTSLITPEAFKLPNSSIH